MLLYYCIENNVSFFLFFFSFKHEEISDEYVGAQVHPGLIVGIVFGVLSVFIVAIVVVGYR